MSRTYKDRPWHTWNWRQAKRRDLRPRYIWSRQTLSGWRLISQSKSDWDYWPWKLWYDPRPLRCCIRKTRLRPCTCIEPGYCGCHDLVRATKIDWGFRGKRWIKYRYVRWSDDDL